MTTATTHHVRKYQRVHNDAKHEQVYEVLVATAEDGAQCRIEVRRGYRSRGYQSGYESAIKYWVLMERNDEAFGGFTFISQARFDKWRAETIAAGFTACTPTGTKCEARR